MSEKKYSLAGIIGRWKPLHLGGYRVLKAACENSDFLKVGIGSSNKYDLRNPFTAEESKAMINAALSPDFSNYELIEVPDFGHIPEYRDGKRWVETVREKFGNLEVFISSNDYVRGLLGNQYKLIQSWELLRKDEKLKMRGTYVRIEIAKFGEWESLVPEKVAEYIKKNKLDERFRKEFGLKTLSLAYSSDIDNESRDVEKMNVIGEVK